MNVLIACEFSGVVRDAFLEQGHHAISCDLLPSERPGPHHQGNVVHLLDDGWDMMIAFPPCTYLSYAGNRHWNAPGREERRLQALEFVRLLMNAPIPRIAIENPKGCISTVIRREDQVIQPWMFGHPYTKYTCLWLKNLPPLMATCVVPYRTDFVLSAKRLGGRSKNRSRTFSGIAQAMAAQWTFE